jgi:DNA adenine methylase
LLAHAVKYTPYSREEHRLAQQGIEGIEDEIEQARQYLVDNIQSFSKVPGNAWSSARQTLAHTKDENGKHIGGGQADSKCMWDTLPDRLLTATDHLKRCYIENDDAVKVIERWATPHTAIYADPPYVGLEDYYAHNAKSGKDDSLDLHYRLASALNTVEASAVIVSYYPCELVDELYPEETWERHYRETVASSAGITRQSKSKKRPKRTELLLVRKRQGDAPKVNLSGQMGLF